MLGRVSPQGSLLAPDQLFSHLVSKGSFYERLAAVGPELISDDDFAGMYAPTMGRPSVPPSLMMRALLLATRDKSSDRESSRRSRVDLDWKMALGLPADHPGIGATTISLFRARVVLHDADQALFRKTVRKACDAGLFPRKVLGLIDSSPVLGAGAVCDTYGLLRRAIAQVVRSVGEDALSKALRRALKRYLNDTKPDIDWGNPGVRRAELRRMVEASRRLLAAVADRPEASRRFDGHKLHLIEEESTEIVLAVDVGPGNGSDGDHAAPLVEQAREAGVRVDEVVGDMAYGDGDTRAEVEAVGAKVVAKVPPTHNSGYFAKTEFTIDPDAPSATCPAGVTATRTRRRRDDKGRATVFLMFDENVCAACPLRPRCVKGRGGRTIAINVHEARLVEARAQAERPAVKRKLRRRAVIERKIDHLQDLGAKKARYRGRRKTKLQAFLAATVANLTRLDLLGAFQTGEVAFAAS